MKKNIDLKDFALVVLSYNRKTQLERILKTWSTVETNIYLLDGSDVKIYPEGPKEYQVACRIEYIYEKEISKRLFYVVEELRNRPEIEYVALLADDDYFIPSAVKKIIMHLRGSDYISACGHCMGFSKHAEMFFALGCYKKMADYKIDEESSVERAFNHMKNYEVTQFYSVVKKKNWCDAFEMVAKISVNGESFFAAGEYLLEMYLSYTGKSLTLPVLLWLRNRGEVISVHNLEQEKMKQKKFLDWWKKDVLFGKKINHTDIFKVLVATLVQKNNISHIVAEKHAAKIFNGFYIFSTKERRKDIFRDMAHYLKRAPFKMVLIVIDLTGIKKYPLAIANRKSIVRTANYMKKTRNISVDLSNIEEFTKLL